MRSKRVDHAQPRGKTAKSAQTLVPEPNIVLLTAPPLIIPSPSTLASSDGEAMPQVKKENGPLGPNAVTTPETSISEHSLFRQRPHL